MKIKENIKDVSIANTKIDKILSGGYYLGERKSVQNRVDKGRSYRFR